MSCLPLKKKKKKKSWPPRDSMKIEMGPIGKRFPTPVLDISKSRCEVPVLSSREESGEASAATDTGAQIDLHEMSLSCCLNCCEYCIYCTVFLITVSVKTSSVKTLFKLLRDKWGECVFWVNNKSDVQYLIWVPWSIYPFCFPSHTSATYHLCLTLMPFLW